MIDLRPLAVLVLLAFIVQPYNCTPVFSYPEIFDGLVELVKGREGPRWRQANEARRSLFLRDEYLSSEEALKKLRTLADSKDLQLSVPLDIDELLAYAEAEDAKCGDKEHMRNLLMLVHEANNKYTGLHHYMNDALYKQFKLCEDHPRHVIGDFKSLHEYGWELVVTLGTNAAKLGYPLHGGSELSDWFDRNDPLKEMILAEIASSGMQEVKLRSFIQSLKTACRMFVGKTGWVLRKAVEQPRAGVSEEEMRDWLRYLEVCERSDFSRFVYNKPLPKWIP